MSLLEGLREAAAGQNEKQLSLVSCSPRMPPPTVLQSSVALPLSIRSLQEDHEMLFGVVPLSPIGRLPRHSAALSSSASSQAPWLQLYRSSVPAHCTVSDASVEWSSSDSRWLTDTLAAGSSFLLGPGPSSEDFRL